MYGYVRPFRPELKIREFERYKAAYCGLCHALRRRFGLRARFCVNYDMTLPLLLLPEAPQFCRKRCPASPFKKKCVVCVSAPLDRIADMTMILAYHKMSDAVHDCRGFKRLGARLGRFALRRAYRRAAAREAAFDCAAAARLAELAELEKTLSAADAAAALDRTAACFAEITALFALLSPEYARLWREIFYHIGRYVYILDAADDYEADVRRGRFNPLSLRYNLRSAALPDDVRDDLRKTIELSLSMAAAAFELLPTAEGTPLCANILYLGLPAVVEEVFSEERHRKKKGRA